MQIRFGEMIARQLLLGGGNLLFFFLFGWIQCFKNTELGFNILLSDWFGRFLNFRNFFFRKILGNLYFRS